MPIDLEKFKIAYEKWVEESLPEFRASNEKIFKTYPLIVSDDAPWTPYKGESSEQTFALVTSGGLRINPSGFDSGLFRPPLRASFFVHHTEIFNIKN